MSTSRRRPDPDAAERPAGGPPWWASLSLASVAVGWYLLSGEAVRFAGMLADAGVSIPQLPAPQLPGIAPAPPLMGAAGVAGVAAAGGVAWVYRESRRLVRGQSTRRFLRGADTELARPVLEGVLYRDGVTLLYAPPGMGKSEFAFALIAASVRAAVQGAPVDFVGLKVYPAKWYILSEQTKRGLLPYLRRHGLTAADADPWVVWETWHNVKRQWRGRLRRSGNPTWEETGPGAVAAAKRHGCTAFVLDTLFQWAADTSGALQDIGGVRKTFDPLQTMAEAGVAVLTLLHTNKNGSYAGSYALQAACDIMYRLHHPAKTPENVRELERDKTRAEGSPPHHLMSLEGDGYRAWGATKGVVRPGKAPEPEPRSGAASAGEEEGVQGAATPNERTNERSADTPTEAGNPLLQLLTAEGVSTAALCVALGWDRAKLKRELDKLKAGGQAEPTGEKEPGGKAAMWRRTG